jgi:hypothetical protein
MSPFVIHGYPKWADITVWILRTLSYAFCTLTGAAALLFTPASLKPEAYVIVGSMLAFGLVCMVATLFKRFIVEWVFLFFLTAGTSMYVASVWITALNNNKVIAGASIFTVLILLMFIRIIELTVFWQRNARAARLQQGLSHAD